MNKPFALPVGNCIHELQGLDLPEASRLAEELETAQFLPFQKPLPYTGEMRREADFFGEDSPTDFRSLMARHTTAVEANRSNLLSTFKDFLDAIGKLENADIGPAESLAKGVSLMMAELKAPNAVAAYASWLRGGRDDERRLESRHKRVSAREMLESTMSLDDYAIWLDSGKSKPLARGCL